MSIKTDLNLLTAEDTYSLLLFALYKMTDNPDYASLSQLSYILDKDSLLKLCSFYGGKTLTVPTIEELEKMFDSLLLYYRVKFEGEDLQKISSKSQESREDFNDVLQGFDVIKNLLENYKFNKG